MELFFSKFFNLIFNLIRKNKIINILNRILKEKLFIDSKIFI